MNADGDFLLMWKTAPRRNGVYGAGRFEVAEIIARVFPGYKAFATQVIGSCRRFKDCAATPAGFYDVSV
jgi:hypothetical protein